MIEYINQFNLAVTKLFRFIVFSVLLALLSWAGPSFAQSFQISVDGTAPNIRLDAAGESAFFLNAGVLDDGSNTPISLRATLVSISAGHSVTLRRVGDNPTVVSNNGGLEAEVLWEAFNRNTGLPISGNAEFLITDIDGNGGNMLESVSALCLGLSSFTTNGVFMQGVNANSSGAAQTNISITESNGAIRGDGTQGQSSSQQEGYLQYNWTNVDNWTVRYFSTRSGRFFQHDGDGDIPFDGTEVSVDLIDLATIKRPVFGPNGPPTSGETITWEIEVSNLGPQQATNLSLTDTLPAGIDLSTVVISASTGNAVQMPAPNDNIIDWTGFSVNVGLDQSETLTITATINASPGDTLTNTVTDAKAIESFCSSRDQREFSFVIAELPDPALEITKTAGTATVDQGAVTNLTDAGDTIEYTYVITNTGNVTINNVRPVDAGPTFGNNGTNQASGLSAFSPASANLAVGESATFTATYTLTQENVQDLADGPSQTNGVNNTATATGDAVNLPTGGQASPTSNSSSVSTGFSLTANAEIEKTVTNEGDFDSVGDIIEYQFVITNTGNIELTQVRPRDNGPNINNSGRSGQFSQVVAVAPFTTSTTNPPNNIILQPGESQTYTATYTLAQNDLDNVARSSDPLTSIDNTATVEAQSRLGSIQNVSDSVETGFAPAPSFTITKSVTNLGGFNTVGNTINYQFTVQNTGNTTINNVTVSDSGPTFNGQPAQGNLSNISPSNANLAPATATSPGQIQVFNAQYQLRQQDIDNLLAAADSLTAIQNTATVAGIPTGGLLPPVSDTFNTGFAVEGELTLVKNVSGPTTGAGSNTGVVDEGDTLSYTFQVQNSGDITVNNIAIDDDGPLFDGVAGQGTFSSINCGATSLQPNQSTTCNATYTLAQSDIDTALANGASGTDAITNSAIATGALGSGTALESDPDTTTASIPLVSSIEMTKTAGTPTVNFGADTAITDPEDQVTFTLVAENTGNNTLTSVTISDSLVSSVTCAAITANGNTFTNASGSLEPGDSVSCTAVYEIEQSDINSGEVLNTGSVTSTDAAGNTVNDDDTVRTGFTQRASLSLNKVGTPADLTSADQDITYTFTLENTGNVSLSDPQVIDAQCDLPGTTLTASSGFVSGDTNDDDILDSDETWTFTCTRDIDQAEFEAGDITNTATASGTPPAGLDTPMSTAGALVRAEQSAGIALDKLAGLPTTDQGVAGVVDEGDTVLYTFTVENTGNVTLNAVSVTDPLIEGQPGSPTVTCPVSTLAPGVTTMCTATYTLTLDDINAGQVNNTATATGIPVTDFPIDPPTAMSGAMVTISPAPSLTVVKTVDAITGPLSTSTQLTYRYTVTNTGNVTIENVVPVDTAGPSFNNVAGASSLSAFAPLTADLAPGDNQEFVATYTLDQADINNIGAAPDPTTAIDNTATATGDPVNGVLAAVQPSTVDTGLATNPSLALVKTSTPLAALPAPQVGSLVNYSFALSNNGNVDISNPQVEDALCQPSTILTSIDSGDDGDGILQVGETFVYSCSYALTQDDLNAGTIQNTATATGQDPAGNDVSDVSGSADDNDDPNNTPIPQAASWTVVKSTPSVPSQAGDTLDYSFVVENTGNLSITGIVVDDPKCAATPAFVSGDTNNDNALDPNETFTYSCTSIAVIQDEVNATAVDNTVTISGTASGGVTLDDASNTLSTPIDAAPVLSSVKSVVGAVTTNLGANSAATDAGDQITYRVDVTNDGNVTIDNLSIIDPGPTFGGETATGDPLVFNCVASSLDPNASTSCTAVYTLRQDDVDNAIEDGGVDEVENSAFARGDNPSAVTGTTDSDPTSATASIVNESSLTVVKTASAPTITGGADPAVTDLGGAGADTIDYTITTTNSGNTTLNNVSISDPLLAGLTLVCNVGGNPFANDGTESLAVGAEVVCNATYPLIQDDLDNAGVTNIATASALDPSGADISSSDELLTPLTQNTSISLLKQVQSMNFAIAGDTDLPNAGDTITYEFTLDNTGNVSLSTPTVSDDLCDSPPVLQSGDDGDGILSATETFVFTCTNTLTEAEINAGDVENTATGTGTPPVDSGLPNPVAIANSVAVIAQESSISFIKMAGVPSTNVGDPSRTDEGDTISYTFDVTNTGNVTLTNIVVSDPLITGAPNNGTITCPVPFELTAGSTGQCTATYTLTQDDIDLGSVMNEASVAGDPPVAVTPPPMSMSSAMVPIDPAPSMTIAKEASTIPTTVVAGDVITYTFTIVNTGNVTIDGVLPLDNGPTFNNQSATNSLSAFDTEPNSVILAPGEQQIFTATYELSQTDLDNIASSAGSATAVNNSATIVGEPENGVLPPVTPSSAITGVETAPSIELIKSSVAPDPAVVGANITYTFNLENTGNVSVANPTIADALCQAPTGNLSFTNGFVSGDTGAQPGVLDVGETWIFSCTSALTQVQIDAGTVENTATATGTEPGGDPVTDISDSGNPGDGAGDDDVTNTPLNQTPSWTVVKSTSSIPVNAGDTLEYTFVLDNTGNVTIVAPVLTDVKCAVPAGTANLVSGDVNGDNNIAPDEVFTYSCTSISVTQDEVDAAQVNNSVSVAGTPPAGTVLPPATDNLSTPVAQTATWEVEKATVSTPTAAGQTLDYTFELRNTGNVSIANIAVDDAKCASAPLLAPATASAGDIDGDTEIDPNEIFTYSCTSIPVIQDEVNLGQVDNTVTISGAPPIGTVEDAVDTVSVEIDAAPALSLVKSAAAPTVGFGALTSDTDEDDTIVYSFLVTNSGNVTVDSIVVNDLGQEFGGQTGTGSLSAISCPLSAIEPQQSTTCTATYTLSQDDIDNAIAGGADSASNSATVSGQDPSDTDVTSLGSTATTTIDSAASLDLIKTAGVPTTAGGSDPAITDPGDTIDYTIEVTNDGNTVVNNAQITDPLIPAADLNCAPFVNDGSESIAVGESVICNATYEVTQIDLNVGEVLNTATVNAVDGANSPIVGSDAERVGFTQRSSIELSKSGTQLSVDPVPQEGDIITYTFLVENTGNVSQSDPVVTDALCPAPDDAPTPVLIEGTTNITGDINTNGILDASEVFTFSCEYAIDQDDITAGEIVNTATATSTPPVGLAPPTSTAGTLITAEQEFGIALDKVAGVPSVGQGLLPTVTDEDDTISYVFTVKNTGNVILNNIVLTDPLITGEPNNGTIMCPETSLAPEPAAGTNPSPVPVFEMDCTATYTLTQADIDAGERNNTANVVAEPVTDLPVLPEDFPSADSGAMVVLPANPSLTVVKSASDISAGVTAGTVITYSYVITNTGNVTITDVAPDDGGPSFNGVVGENALSVFDPLNVDLAPGEDQTFTATYELSQTDIDNMAAAASPNTAIDNTTTAVGTPANGSLPAVTPSTVETGVLPEPSITLIKTAVAPDPALVGSAITYTFALNNDGNVTITSPSIEDAQCQSPGSVLSLGSGFISVDTELGEAADLDVGETWTFMCTRNLTQVDIDAGSVTNTAIATGQDPAGEDVSDNSGDAADNDNPTITPLAQTPSWTVAKSTSSEPTQAGDTLLYNFVVTNTGNVSISNISVSDDKCATNIVLDSGDIDNNDVLAPTEIFSYSCTSIGVTQDEVNAGEVSNTVVISGTPPSGTVPNEDATIGTPIAAAPSLSLSKTAADPTTGLGALTGATDVLDTIAYSFEVTNNGNVTIDSIVIDDPNPTFGGEAADNAMSVASCPVTELAPGQSTTCTASYVLGQNDIDNAIAAGVDSVSNSATVNGEDPNTTDVTSPESTATTTIDSQPDIEIVKSVISTVAAPNPTISLGAIDNITDPLDIITYTLTVTNTGNTELSNINVTDVLDPDVTCIDQTNGSVTLLPAASIVCEAEVVLDQDDLNTGSVMNTADVEGSDPIGTSVDDDDELTTLLNQRTSIELTKAASQLTSEVPTVGEVITYSFSLTNSGNVSLSNPNVQDPNCPSNLDITTGFDGGDTNDNSTLDAGEVWLFSCDYITTQDDVNLGRVENTATGTGTPPATSGLPNPMSTANSLAEIDQETGIALIKTGSMATVDQGVDNAITDINDTIAYTFEVENTGNVTLTDVVIDDNLITSAIMCTPAFETGSAPLSPSFTQSTIDLTSTQSTLCTANYVLDQDDINAGQVMNEASVTGTPPDTTPPADPPLVPPSAVSSSMVPIASVPRLSVVKTVSVIADNVIAGDVVTYTYTVTNIGNTTIDNVLPVDTNGPSFNGVAGENSLTAFVATDATLPISLLPQGEQVFTAQYTLSQSDIDNAVAGGTGAISNTATATGDPVIGTLGAVTPSTALETIAGVPVIELLKSSTAPADPIAVGDLINYSFTLENSGNVTITSPVIADDQCVTPSGDLTFSNGFDAVDAELGEADELDVGETWTFSCSYPVDQDDIDAGTVQNTATATGQDPAGIDVDDVSDSLNVGDTGAEDDDPTNTPLNRTASFTVEKTSNSVPTQEGDTLVYNFTLRNTGNVSITDPQVSDAKCDLPAVPSNGDADLIAGDINFDNIITPNEVWVLSCTSIAVTQTEVDNANVPNSVSVTGTAPDGVTLEPAEDSLNTPVVAAPSLSVAKSASEPTQSVDATTSPGDTISYSYIVENTGNVTLTNIAINDAGPTFNNVAAENTLAAISCDTTSLAPTGSTSCQVDYVLTQNDIDSAIAGGANSVSNTATASATPPIGTAVESPSSTATTTVDSAPSIDISKTVIANSITTALGVNTNITDVDDTISYNLAVSNTGNSLLSNIVVTDTIADSVTCPVSDDNTIASIAVGGETVNCIAVYSLNQENITAGSVTNEASVIGSDPFNTSVAADDEITTDLPQTPLVSLIKSTAGESTVNADGSFNQAFNFTLSNVGNVPLTNAQIIDDLTAQFGACFVSVASPGTVSIADVAPANDSNSGAVGALPNIASIAVLGVGDSLVLSDFTAQFSQLAPSCTFPDPAENSANATAAFADFPAVTDISDNQQDPANGVANDGGSPTPFTPPVPEPELGLAKAAEVLAFNEDTTFSVEFTMLLQNTGDVNVNNLSLFDDIATQYGAAFVASDATVADSGIISAPQVTLFSDAEPLLDTVLPVANANYDGAAQSMIVASPTSVLGVGDVIQVVFTVMADPALLARPLDDFENIADVSGTAPNGEIVLDESNSGSDPTTGSGGEGEATIVTLADIASLPIVLGQVSSERVSQNSIQVRWQTQTEVANLGFNIYGRVGEQWLLLNDAVIPAKGDSVEIVDYQMIVDSEAELIALSDIDGRGKETLHGPYRVGQSYGTQPERQTTDWQEAIERRQTKEQLRREQRRQRMLERNRARQAKRTGTGG